MGGIWPGLSCDKPARATVKPASMKQESDTEDSDKF